MSQLIRFSCSYLVLITGLFLFSVSQAELRKANNVVIDADVTVEQPLEMNFQARKSPVYAVIASQN